MGSIISYIRTSIISDIDANCSRITDLVPSIQQPVQHTCVRLYNEKTATIDAETCKRTYITRDSPVGRN